MSSAVPPRRVVVVGGGLTGLLVARRLSLAGVDVVVLEADGRLGGQIRTIDLAGRRVDVGAEAVHLLSPAGRGLVDELGAAGDVVGSVPGASFVLTPRGLRRLPAGVGPAGPTKLLPVLRSGMLSPLGLVRAGLEPLLAAVRRPLRLGPGRDVAVGAFTSSRFGREVTARFVDPLLGGLHSGDVDRLSLRACVPTLVPAATSRRSLVLRRRPATTTKPVASAAPGGPTGAPPVTFASFPTGLSTLVERVAADVTGPIRTGARVARIERAASAPAGVSPPTADDSGAGSRPGGYLVHLADGGTERADAVVLAVPAHTAGPLIAPLCADATEALSATEFADTAAVVLAYRRDDVAHVPALAGTGLLVPRDMGGLLKAATHLSTKWPHLAPAGGVQGDSVGANQGNGDRPGDGSDLYLLRLSAGRAGQDVVAGLDDAELVARLRTDLARHTGLDAEPIAVHVQRWSPGLPQLTVGHLDRLDRARTALARDTPGVHLAGASYDGVGLTSCIASADRIAAELLGH